jgi:zinc transport system permease protein
LFGDILSISNQDIIWIYTILMLVGVLLSIFWQRLLLLTLNEELGVASGLNRFAQCDDNRWTCCHIVVY